MRLDREVILDKQKVMVENLKSHIYNIDDVSSDLLHGSIGIVTEAAEIQDAIKKCIFYGKELDTINLCEEIGDCLFYLELLCQSLNTTLTKEMDRNQQKLAVRYKDGFSKKAATTRDLESEREVLNG